MGKDRDPELDFLLTMALEIHDNDLLCPACGGYRVDCQDDDSDGYYEIDDSIICYATAARQDYEKETGSDVDSGTLIRIVDTRVEDFDSRPIRTAQTTPSAPPRDEALG